MWPRQVYGHKSQITSSCLDKKMDPHASRLKQKKNSRGSDTTELPVGTKFHIDFCFFNVVSIRGFTAALIIVEATSRYIWIFPSRSKRAPIDLCLYFFKQMKRL